MPHRQNETNEGATEEGGRKEGREAERAESVNTVGKQSGIN